MTTVRWWWTVGLGGVLVACVSTWPAVAPQPYHRIAPIEGALPVGADECEICHDEVAGHAPAPAYHADCESCHGPGGLHADSAEVTDIRFPADRDCLACHDSRRSHLDWTGADHARAGIGCSDCHEPHNREPDHLRQVAEQALVRHADAGTRLCVSCHVEVASRLELPSHHPVSEGMMSCTDCHEPHGSRSARLGSRNELCSGCHQDYAGPWIFEHTPVAEDCGYCHAPHGAVGEWLLETTQPGVCISCHTLPQLGAAHSPAAYVSPCTDCHSAVHGSYTDPHLLR